MPGQAERKISSPETQRFGDEFAGKNVLIVDDSIVRGTTSKEIVQMADAGVNQVTFTRSTACCFQCVRHQHVNTSWCCAWTINRRNR